MVALLVIIIFASLVISTAIKVLTKPMTCCLTFDDGLKVHSEIAAPLLEKLGWRGTFNVPTEFMANQPIKSLTIEQATDCCLIGHEDELMNWQDVNRLLAAGHEAYPHTLNHTGLLRLEKAGDFNEMRRQISESKADFIQHTRVTPYFFCSPHNSTSPLIEKLIHDNGMEILEVFRANYGSVVEGVIPPSIDDYLRLQYRQGASNADLAIHGIDQTRGGWSPFNSISDFELFLKKIKALEDEGLIRITAYSKAHRRYTAFSALLVFWDLACAKFRRIVYSHILMHSPTSHKNSQLA